MDVSPDGMLDARSRRFPAWTVLIGALVFGLALAALSFYLWISSAEIRRWNDMRAQCERLEHEAWEREGLRPVLRGEPRPGNAWDDYTAGLLMERSGWWWSPSIWDPPAHDYLSGGPKADREVAETAVSLYAEAIDAFRRGASRGVSRRHADWQNGTRGFYKYTFVEVTVCQARLWSEAGRSKEAMELVLDVAQVGLDIARSGDIFDEHLAMTVLGRALSELREQIVRGTLERDVLLEASR